MRRFRIVFALLVYSSVAIAQSPVGSGPYKVLKSARVGGEGGSDYIYADVLGRRLYIPRGGTRARWPQRIHRQRSSPYPDGSPYSISNHSRHSAKYRALAETAWRLIQNPVTDFQAANRFRCSTRRPCN